MAKYNLIAVSADEQNVKFIKVKDQKDGKIKENVSLADIDNFTSGFNTKLDFMRYLHETGVIDFSEGYAYISTEYKGETYKFKCIYGSELINKCSKNIVDSKIEYKKVNAYLNYCKEIIDKIENDKEYLKQIEESKYIKPSLKAKMLNYANLYNTIEKRSYELNEENDLKSELYVDLLQYKAFRGVYIFNEGTKYRKTYEYKPRTQVNYNNTIVRPQPKEESTEEIFKNIVVDPNDLDDFNHGYDKEEYLTPGEYEDCFGKGGRHI